MRPSTQPKPTVITPKPPSPSPPPNPKNLVAACNSPVGAGELMVSNDAGLTWVNRIIGTGSGPGGDGLPKSFCDPSIAFDRFGNCYLVYLDLVIYAEEPINESNDPDILIRFSDDSGATWSKPARVSDDKKKRSQFLC